MLRELIHTNETRQIPVASIRTDGGTQMRAALDDDTVFEYTQAMAAANGWGTFPAVVAYYDGSAYWLGDGFHRVQAYRDAFPAENDGIPCEVRSGTRRDAILHAAGANADHGLRRTQADKRRAVETLLRDEEWAAWSDNEIARRCNVSPSTVGTVRKSLSLSKLDSEKPAAAPAERTYTTKHGTQATMSTGSIGKNKPEAPKVEVWQLERVVSAIPNVKASTLRTAARQRKGHWLFDTAASRAQAEYPNAWNQTRLVNAMNSVADQMERAEQRKPSLSTVDSEKPVSPEQRQYDMAVVTPIAVPQPPAAKPISLDALPVVDSDLKFTPNGVPADLAQRGWELRQVPGSGRYYCRNANGPRATGVFDKVGDAIQAAYEMQVDLGSEPVEETKDPDVETIERMWNTRTATGVLQNMVDYWSTCLDFRLYFKRDPRNQNGLEIKLIIQDPIGGWHEWRGSTLDDVVRKADLGL